jgi:hypothetical protein
VSHNGVSDVSIRGDGFHDLGQVGSVGQRENDISICWVPDAIFYQAW